jgi:hypothetical protein
LNEDRNTTWVEGSRDDSLQWKPLKSLDLWPLRCGKYTVFIYQYWQHFTSEDHPTKPSLRLNEGGFGSVAAWWSVNSTMFFCLFFTPTTRFDS